MGDSFEKVIQAMEEGESQRKRSSGIEQAIAAVSPENRHAAISAHELYITLRSGGFTENQALKIVANRIAFSDTDEQGD